MYVCEYICIYINMDIYLYTCFFTKNDYFSLGKEEYEKHQIRHGPGEGIGNTYSYKWWISIDFFFNLQIKDKYLKSKQKLLAKQFKEGKI